MVDSRGAAAQDGRRAERLELRLPTTATQLPAVRAMAGDLAMRMDYDLDAVEDLRLAVDEACAILSLLAQGDDSLTVVFESTRSGLHIEAWIPTPRATSVPLDGFGWAVLQTLVDAVHAESSDQRSVAAGNGSAGAVALITMDKYLPGQHPADTVDGADQNMSVSR